MKPSVPARAAVLVIDVQRGLFGSEPPPFAAASVLGRINAVTAQARQAGIPVIFIQHDGDPSEPDLAPFSAGWELHPHLQVRPGELILRKTTCDAFYRTALEAALRSRGITTLLLTGFATDFCVDATLRNALSRDFHVIVVADAHTTTDNPLLNARTVRAYYNWVWANLAAHGRASVLKAAELRFPPAPKSAAPADQSRPRRRRGLEATLPPDGDGGPDSSAP